MPKTIIIIDDEPLVRESLRAFLAKHPCEVLTAEDGEIGTTLLGDLKTPALFLVDLLMPNMDGWGFLDKIREHAAALKVQHQIILLSGSANAELIANQEEVGFISKPFSLADLKAKILPFLEQG
jgi:CheY-like chemotaxis protein